MNPSTAPSAQQNNKQSPPNTQPPFLNTNNNNNFSHSLFDPNHQSMNANANANAANAHLPPINNLSIQSPVTNVIPNATMFNPNIANMRTNLSQPLPPHSALSPQNNQAAVLQDFSSRNMAYSNNQSSKINYINSPNSSPRSPHKVAMNIDYNAVNRRLRDDYKKIQKFWKQTQQNSALYAQIERPLVEALLLPKHRPQILEYERKIIDFLISDDSSYHFPRNMSSFNRLLVHRMAENFGLNHQVIHGQISPNHHSSFNAANDNKAIVLNKTLKCKFASIELRSIDIPKLRKFHLNRLTDLELAEWEEKKTRYSPTNYTNYNRYSSQQQNSSQIITSQQQQQQLLNDGNIGNNDVIVHDSNPRFDDDQHDEGQKQPVRMLLKKDNMNATNLQKKQQQMSSSPSSIDSKKDKLTPEIKQAKYDKMKERIFSPVNVQNAQNLNDENEENKESVQNISENEMLKQSEGENKLKNDGKNLQIANEQNVSNKKKENEHIKHQKEGHKDIIISGKGFGLVKEKKTKDINVSALFKESKERLKKLSEQAKSRKQQKSKLLKASNLQKTLEAKNKNKDGMNSIYQKWATDDVDGTMRKNINKKSNQFTGHSLIPKKKEQHGQVQANKLIDSVINNQNSNQSPDGALKQQTQPNAPNTHHSEVEYDRNATMLKVPITDSQFVRNHPTNNVFKPGTTVGAIQKLLDPKQQQQQQANNQNSNVVNNQFYAQQTGLNGVNQQLLGLNGFGQAQNVAFVQQQNALQQQVQQQQQQSGQQFTNLYNAVMPQQNVNGTGKPLTDSEKLQALQQQKVVVMATVNEYNRLFYQFQMVENAGTLTGDQQAYRQSLVNGLALQQQNLARLESAVQLVMNNCVNEQEKEKVALIQQIEHHKQLQLQLIGVQQGTQHQQIAVQQSLQLHTMQYQQAQNVNNQNAMYVATLQMQQDQASQQQLATKLQQIMAQLIQVGQNMNALQQQLASLSGTNSTSHSVTPQQSQPQMGGNQQNQINAQQQQQQQQQQQHHANKQPNPTVNALILHTGNNAQNVNINIYADGQSGQNNVNQQQQQQQQKKQQQQQQQQTQQNNSRGYNPRTRPNSFQQQSQQQQQQQQQQQHSNKDGMNKSDILDKGGSDKQNDEQSKQQNVKQNSNEQQQQQQQMPVDMVHDVPMGPRHQRTNVPNKVQQNQQNQKQPQQQQQQQQGQVQTQQSTQSQQQQQQMNNGPNMKDIQQQNINFNAMRQQQQQQQNNLNFQQNYYRNKQQQHPQQQQNNNNAQSNSKWMNGWFENRDQKTQTNIIKLQQTARATNKKLKNFPKRHPPTPPDQNANVNYTNSTNNQSASNQNNNNNNNRYQRNANSNQSHPNRRRGGYQNQNNRGRGGYNSRNYDSRRNNMSNGGNGNFHQNNRFNANSNINANDNNNHSQQQNNVNSNQQQQSQQNKNVNNRPFNRHRRNRSYNNSNQRHMNRQQNNSQNNRNNVQQQQQRQMMGNQNNSQNNNNNNNN